MDELLQLRDEGMNEGIIALVCIRHSELSKKYLCDSLVPSSSKKKKKKINQLTFTTKLSGFLCQQLKSMNTAFNDKSVKSP